jgi:hypothetical protein
MSRAKTLKSLFRRYRRPGDIVFAWLALVISILLIVQIAGQTAWRPGGKLFAQPRFWPAVSLFGMVVFGGLHLLGSAMSERIEGRWKEVWLWCSALEYAAWFIAYALAVPYLGYLLATIVFAVLLVCRAGYRRGRHLIIAVAMSVVIVLVFKTFLKVNLPSGQVYDWLPAGLRHFMLTHF